MSSIHTPQEKKRLSYERDRRNVYGENSKASRKKIPLRKKIERQTDRRVANQLLPAALNTDDLLADDSAENRIIAHIKKKKRIHWRKTPDAPLGKILKYGKNPLAPRQDFPFVPQVPSVPSLT
jgi:hypothetical protein